MTDALNKLYWWLTHNSETGAPYQTLYHCIPDKTWIGITLVYCFSTFVGYMLIAREAQKELKYVNKKLKIQSLKSFIAVFVFCGLAGYFIVGISVEYPVYKLRGIFGSILMVWTWILYYNIRQGGLFRSITDELDSNKKEIIELKEQLQKRIDRLKAIDGMT